MFSSLLVANRGEIARRVLRTAREMGLSTVAVHSEVDADLPFVIEADQAVQIGSAGSSGPAQSYRNIEAILAAARRTGADAVHPGYGFLSEDPAFARAVRDAGLVWVGPEPESMAAMGDKVAARNLMEAAGVPVAAGTDRPMRTGFEAALAAEAIGFPVMVKAAAGGGGLGMAVVDDPSRIEAEFERVQSYAERVFGNRAVFVEEYFPRVRHVEVQILGLADGTVHALAERECSVQRRHQKLAEETPSPALTPVARQAMLDAARRAGEAVDYRGAGTVEFLFVPDTGAYYFLEMNTRLQVEHPITEATLGIDLVAAQLRIAAGESVDLGGLSAHGHALELRVNAEDPVRFLPGPGRITAWSEPEGDGIRVDSGYLLGNTVTPFYDSLLAKLVVWGPDRPTVLDRARAAVAAFTIAGPKHNLAFHEELLANAEFVSGDYDTTIVDRLRPRRK